jgi:hypothetical protein
MAQLSLNYKPFKLNLRTVFTLLKRGEQFSSLQYYISLWKEKEIYNIIRCGSMFIDFISYSVHSFHALKKLLLVYSKYHLDRLLLLLLSPAWVINLFFITDDYRCKNALFPVYRDKL